MTKAEIVDAVVISTGLSNKDVSEAVESVFELILLQLEKGDDVKLPGFGNFQVREKRQRIGRNPKAGEAVPVTARKVVTFKVSQKLKDRANNGIG
jgi:integration host factor subunit alpha